MGFDVVDIDLATTRLPNWLLPGKKLVAVSFDCQPQSETMECPEVIERTGEFLNAAEGAEVLKIAAEESFVFADVDNLGKVYVNNTYNQKHIESVLKLDLVDVEAIRAANFRVAIDCVNSVGGVVIPELLSALG